MVAWPAALPQDQFLDTSYKRRDVRLRTQTDTGPGKVRRKFTVAAADVTVPIVVNGLQRQAFDDFYEVSLQEGSLPFDWEDPITDATVVFRFKPPVPEWKLFLGGSTGLLRLWRTVLNLEIVPGLPGALPELLPLLWSATPAAGDVGDPWDAYMASAFDSVDTIVPGSIVAAPDTTPSLRANFQVGGLHGSSDVCEQLVGLSAAARESVMLQYEVWLDPSVDYLAVGNLGGSQTIAYLTFPGLVGGSVWPGPNNRAYPVGAEATDEGWSARIRVVGSGAIAPYLYVQNKPGSFGWSRVSTHPLRINDLRGAWSVWEQTCTMNTPGGPDGRCRLRINNDTIVDVADIEYRPAGAPGWVNNGMRIEISLTDTAPALQVFNIWTRKYKLFRVVG